MVEHAWRILSTGHPWIDVDTGWDFAPLVLCVILVVLMRWAGLPIRAVTLAVAFAVGVALDLVTDATRMALVPVILALWFAFSIVALLRTRGG